MREIFVRAEPLVKKTESDRSLILCFILLNSHRTNLEH